MKLGLELFLRYWKWGKSAENVFIRVLATENLANLKLCHSNFTFEKSLPQCREASYMVTDFCWACEELWLLFVNFKGQYNHG